MNVFSNFSSLVGRIIPAINNPLVINESAQEIGTIVQGSNNVDYRGMEGYSSQSISLNNGGTLLINDSENGLGIENIFSRKNEFSVCVKFSIHDENSLSEQFLGLPGTFCEIVASKTTVSPGESVEFDILNLTNYELTYSISGDFESSQLNNAALSGPLFNIENVLNIGVSPSCEIGGDIVLAIVGTDVSCVVHVIIPE